MSETVDYFTLWEDDMNDVEVPQFPDDHMERYITQAIDPVVGAQMIQLYVESQSPDAHEHLLQKYIDQLNFHFMAKYMNRQINLSITDDFDVPNISQIMDMAGLLCEIEDQGSARAEGKLAYFEKHYFTSAETGITRPILALRMHSGSFRRENHGEVEAISIPNYATIPVTAVSDYTIADER